MKNLKYESYKEANNLLNDARENNDLPRCIAAIAVCESIIADRLQSYLKFKAPEIFIEKGKEKKFVATGKMVTECLKHFSELKIDVNSKKFGKVESINLFKDLQLWLSSRNEICHGFVKSIPVKHFVLLRFLKIICLRFYFQILKDFEPFLCS
jgi:hypothetical protein